MNRSPNEIAHLIPVITPSAVASHLKILHHACIDRGLKSTVYAEDVHGELDFDVRPAAEFFASEPRVDGSRLTILQFALPWEPAQNLLSRPESLVINYHNLTPPDLIEEYWPQAAPLMRHGLYQLNQFAGRAQLAIADSAFNAMQLRAFGYDAVAIASLLTNSPALTPRPDRGLGHELKILFVGRIAPNKSQHELVKVLNELRHRGINARLDLVGKIEAPLYGDLVLQTVNKLGLADFVTVHGHVDDHERDRLYTDADVFVCLSDHEGFCAPIVEAFSAQLPVVAFDAGAVGETAGQGAILVKSKQPAVVASAVLALLRDDDERKFRIGHGLQRAEYFSKERGINEFFSALELRFGPMRSTVTAKKSTVKSRISSRVRSSINSMAWSAISPIVGRLDRIEQRLQGVETTLNAKPKNAAASPDDGEINC